MVEMPRSWYSDHLPNPRHWYSGMMGGVRSAIGRVVSVPRWLETRIVELTGGENSSRNPVIHSLRSMLMQYLGRMPLTDVTRVWLRDTGIHQPEISRIGELLSQIWRNLQMNTHESCALVIQDIYQLQYTLGLSEQEVEPCLQVMVRLLNGVTDREGRRVNKVRFIRLREPVQHETMWQLNTGTEVRQPLGALLYRDDGSLVQEAKVLCR